MDVRRFTMTNPTAVFSSIAHEAWGNKISDSETENDEHNASQRSRRRLRVSEDIFNITKYNPDFHQITDYS
jgi:hypothetical protein